MIRITDAILLGVAVAGAIYTFQIKHEAELSAKELRTLKAQIGAQKRKISLLQADWALETGPSRLEAIAAQFSDQLMLKPMEAFQIIDPSELPDIRPKVEIDVDTRQAGEGEELTTGGIGDLIQKASEN
ncbi:MAG: hypothetical protein GKR97_06295 [Rhizobiaceae bacterium]|nr:hypothetical protein [Rhizobiaceae bacterium]